MSKKETTEIKKMTLEEYIETYNSKPINSKAAKSFVSILAATVGIIIFACLFLIVLKLFDIHQYAGYAGIVVAILVYIFVYIIPLIKINGQKAFITDLTNVSPREAKKYNKKLREDIADKMIDFTSRTKNTDWYSTELVGRLAIARQTKNDLDLKNTLTEIYEKDVRKAANKMIRDHAVKVGVTTAISQSEKLDTLFVCLYELDLIKQLVLLYGYRPSDAKLAKIYKAVITNTLVAYGAQSASSGIMTGVANKMGDALNGIPLLGSVIGTVIGSASQGVINSTLTIAIGFQTKKYLRKEYNLQDILDNVELADDTDEAFEAEMMNDVKKAVDKKEKKPQLA